MKVDLLHTGYAVVTVTANTDGGESETVTAGSATRYPRSWKPSAENSSDDVYAGGHLVRKSTSDNGSIAVELLQLTNKMIADMGGHTYDTETDSYTATADDTPAYCRFAAITKGRRCSESNRAWETYYALTGYYRVQFEVPEEEAATSEKNDTNKFPTLNGVYMRNADGKIKTETEYSTEALALAAFKEFLNITV